MKQKKDPDKYLLDYQEKKKNGQVTTNPVDDKKTKYDASIKKANDFYNNNMYGQARLEYENALKIKPNDTYAQAQIDKIDDKLNTANDLKFREAYSKAEGLFKSQKWQEAKDKYQESLTYRSDSPEAKARIKECDTKLLALNGTKSVDEKYAAEITKGDNASKIKNFEDAIKAFTEALKFKKGDAIATKKLKDATTALTAQKTKYDAAMLKGNNALKARNYKDAKAAFTEAGTIKPNETIAKTKLTEVENLIKADIVKNDKNNKAAYDAAIAKGNNAIAAKNFPAAKAAFNEAAKLKPTEALPKTKLAEVDKLIADGNKSIDKQYQAYMNIANEAMANKNYQGAIDAYKEALAVKPNEKLPKDKIAEAKTLLDKNSVAVNNNPNNVVDTVGQSDSSTNGINSKSTPEEITMAKGPVFDANRVFSDAKERQKIQQEKRKQEKKKAQNLTLKYETRNITTSLLDAVDAYDKKKKN